LQEIIHRVLCHEGKKWDRLDKSRISETERCNGTNRGRMLLAMFRNEEGGYVELPRSKDLDNEIYM
jgi:hypothetical protein